MPTTTRPTDENITAATIKALASGAFEPGRLERAMWLALDPRSLVLPDGAVDVPSESMGFVIFHRENGIVNHVVLTPCDCADNVAWCKHRIAAALMVRALEAQKAATAAQDVQATQAPTPEPERPTVPAALGPVNLLPEHATTKATKPTTTRRKSCRESDEFLLAWR